MNQALLLTCEHATNHVPRAYRHLFARCPKVLDTHRAIDLGAFELAKDMAQRTGAPLVVGRVTRLLVELNRTRGPKVFSEFTASLPPKKRDALLLTYYDPHRAAVTELVESTQRRGRVALHVGVHSFTPVLHGEPRRAHLGLLFDPRRPLESRFCRAWQRILQDALPDLVIRRNYPYLGRSDGLTTSLRKVFDPMRYLGIELEVNQALTQERRAWDALRATLTETLLTALATQRNSGPRPHRRHPTIRHNRVPSTSRQFLETNQEREHKV